LTNINKHDIIYNRNINKLILKGGKNVDKRIIPMLVAIALMLTVFAGAVFYNSIPNTSEISPQTGDNLSVAIYASLAVLVVVIILLVIGKKYKR